MLLTNFFNSKAVIRRQTNAQGTKRNLNAQVWPKSSDFFSCNGLGEVLSPITPEQSGRIHFGGTDWPAQLITNDSPTQSASLSIHKGMTVQVVGRQGITLLVSTV